MPEITSALAEIGPARRTNLSVYLGLRWKVFPIPFGKNKPRLKNWPTLASSDPNQIAQWWKETPNANIAVLCGKPSGVCVLDFDNHPRGADGTKALRILQALGKIPETPCSKTGGDGFHFLFAHPEGDELTKCIGLLPGVDFIAKGGCVVLPPSLHPKGKPYEWIKGADATPLAQPPDWLLALATMKPAPRAAIAEALLSTRGILDGVRNETLVSVAGTLWNLREIRTASALDTHLQTANRLLCVSELEPGEVSTIAGSVSRLEKHERQPTARTVSTPSTRSRIETPPARETRTLPAIEVPPQESPGVEYLDLADYAANGIPPVPWIAEGWIAEGDIALLAGAAGSGKSTLAAWTAQQLARGNDWCGVKVNLAVPVLYVDEEQGAHTTARLFIRTGGPHKNLAVCQGQGIRLDEEPGRKLLELAIDEHPSGGKPAVVFLDTAQQLFGFADENNATQVGEMFRYLFSLRNEYGCAFVLLHHKRKDSPGHSSGPLEKVRGSTAFGTQADTVWFATLGAEGVAVRQVKRRDGEKTSLQITREVGPDEEITLTGHGPAESLARTLTEDRAAEVLDYLTKNGTTRFGQLRAALALKDYELNRALKKLEAEGLAKKLPGTAGWVACERDS